MRLPTTSDANPHLRAERQLVERDVTGGFVDSPSEIVDRLELRNLGADQAQHDGLASGHEAQRFETAGARRVVLEQEAGVVEFVEEHLGDRVVGALAMPHADAGFRGRGGFRR
jgi:hypothetical protein